MPEKGRKKLRGQPELYDEVKGQVNLSLTATGVQGLDALAKNMGLSRSELVEQIGRGLLPVLSPQEQTALALLLDKLQGESLNSDLKESISSLRKLLV